VVLGLFSESFERLLEFVAHCSFLSPSNQLLLQVTKSGSQPRAS
jgi:hypothetical protein